VTTDDRGIFQIDEVDGTGLSIDKISKEGYEIRVQQKNFDNYPRFEDSVLWENYTDGNPYIFKAWKVVERGYPETSSAKSTYGFKLNQIYSMDFTSSDKRKVKKEGELNLDMRVVFNRNESGDWELNLSVPAGGLIETSDQYMNLAPVNGYQPSLVYNGTERDHMIPKKFYILSRGKLYGRLNVEIRPVMKIGAGLGIEHVMNLEGGRNLEVK